MNRDDIIRMAREAGFQTGVIHGADGSPIQTLVQHIGHSCIVELERFYALAVAKEREARQQAQREAEALRLATILDNEFDTYTDTWSAEEAAAELRRLHYMNSDLMKALRDIYYGSNDVGAVACAAAAWCPLDCWVSHRRLRCQRF